MTRDQRVVALGAGSGAIAMVASVTAIYRFWPVDPGLTDISARIACTLRADAFAILPLLFSVMAVGNNRFLSEAIDPTLQKEDRATLINGRVADNTQQQYLLFLVGTLTLSTRLTVDQMRVIPAAAIVFVVARILFWIGYRIDPLYRAFGFSSTAYLNLGLLLGSLWFWLA